VNEFFLPFLKGGQEGFLFLSRQDIFKEAGTNHGFCFLFLNYFCGNLLYFPPPQLPLKADSTLKEWRG
jgi:hypothetical protein